MLRAQREGEAEGASSGSAASSSSLLAEQAQRDLRVGALQHRAGQAQQHVAAAIVAGRPRVGIAQVGRPLVQARAFALDLQHPAGFAREPLAQRVGLAAHRRRNPRAAGSSAASSAGRARASRNSSLLDLPLAAGRCCGCRLAAVARASVIGCPAWA